MIDRRSRWQAVALLAVLTCTGGLVAQMRSPVFTFHGDTAGSRFGASVAFVPGIVPMLAVGAPGEAPGGAVHVYSLRTGREIRVLRGDSANERFGETLVCGPDANGDGRADLFVGAPGRDGSRGAVYCWSLRRLQPSWRADGRSPYGQLGFALAQIPDRDGDGRDDLVAGAPFDSQSGPETGYVRIVSSANGQTILEIEAPEAGMQFGYAVAPCADRDGDGHPDLLVGAPRTWNPSFAHWHMGSMVEVSAVDGRELVRFYNIDFYERLGEAVLCIPHPAIPSQVLRIGAATWLPNPVRLMRWGVCLAGRSPGGWPGDLWYPEFQLRGERPVPIGDIDGDGRPDLFVGQPRASYSSESIGAFRIYSGRTLAMIDQGFVGTRFDAGGFSACGVPDLDGDGTEDFAVGAPGSGGGGAGCVEVYRAEQFGGGQLGGALGSDTVLGPGDANGDGFADAGRWHAASGYLRVLSSSTITPLWSRSLTARIGAPANTLADVDGDGVRDFAVGSLIVSGANGTDLLDLAPMLGGSLDVELSDAGDIDGDGLRDVVVGDGSGRVFSPRTGAVVGTFGPASEAWPAGDVNGDGRGDLAVVDSTGFAIRSGRDGTVLYTQGPLTSCVELGDVDGDGRADPAIVLGLTNTLVRRVSGRTWHTIWQTPTLPWPYMGGKRADASVLPDVDGDGVEEVAVQSGDGNEGYLVCFSGRNGRLLHAYDGESDFGRGAIPLGDLDGDGRDEIAADGGQVGYFPAPPIGTLILSLPRRPTFHAEPEYIHVMTGGTQEWFVAAGSERAGHAYVVLGSLLGMRPGLDLGNEHLPLNLGAYAATMVLARNTGPFVSNVGVLDSAGNARAALRLAAGLPTWLDGTHLHHAAVIVGPSGISLATEPAGLVLRAGLPPETTAACGAPPPPPWQEELELALELHEKNRKR